MAEVNIAVQYETLNQAGEKIWETARNFWSDVEDTFTEWQQETSEYVEKTHDEIVELANEAKAALSEVHKNVRIIKEVVERVVTETEL